MKIKKINISGYGHFRDFTSPEFSQNVNVIYGSNEAGKTTLMSFIACTIYGLQAHKYPPLQGGIHGGRIFLIDDDDRQFTLERQATARRKTGDFSCFNEEGADANDLWKERFANIDKELFESIFWLTHDELEQLPLEKGRLTDYLYSASLGTHRVNYIETTKKLDAKREDLFKKRGKNQPVNQQIAKIEQLDKKYKEVTTELAGYQMINNQKTELEEEIVKLEQQDSEIQQQHLYYKKLERAWTYWEAYNHAHQQLNELITEKQQQLWKEKISSIEALIKAVPAQRQFLSQTNELQLEKQQVSAKIQIEIKKLGIDWNEQHIEEFSCGLAGKEHIRSTKNCLEKLEQDKLYAKRAIVEAEGRYNLEKEKAARIKKELEQAQHMKNHAKKTSAEKPWILLIYPAIVTAIVMGIFALLPNDFLAAGILHQGIVAGVAILVASMWMYSYFQWRTKKYGILTERQYRDEQIRDEAIRNLKFAEAECDKEHQHEQYIARDLQKAMTAWHSWLEDNKLPNTSKPDEIMAIIMSIENIQYQIEIKKSLEKKLQAYMQEVLGYRSQVEQMMESLGLVLPESQKLKSFAIEEYLEQLYSSISKQLQQEDQALQSIKLLAPPEHTRDELLSGLQATNILHIQGQLEEDKNNITEIRTKLADKREAIGKYRQQLDQLATDDRMVELNVQRTQEQDTLFTNVKEWTIATMTKWILEKSKNTFEAQHQPEVMIIASGLMSSFTEGCYQKLALPIGETAIKVQASNGDWLQIDQLSQGTKEQLYLSLRLGFLQQFVKRQSGWPIFMDDILVNFDKGRMEAAIKTINQLGNNHQIFFFTCHEHIAKAFIKLSSTQVDSYKLEGQELDRYS